MLNNNFQNIFIKFGLWLGTGFLIAIVGISNVFADITNNDFSFIGYTYNQTWSTNSNGSNSGTTWIISDNNLPYIYIDICSTGETATSIVNINNVQGNVSYLGSTNLKIRCSFGSYNPMLVRHYFKVNTWNQVSSSFDEWNVNFTMNFKNNAGWNIQSQVKNIATGNVGFNNDDAIINNNNQNTQNIINNNNNNTQEIINNQNANTQDMINSQKICKNYDISSIIKKNSYLTSNGSITTGAIPWGITDYININNSSIELLVQTEQSTTSTHFCFYNTNKSLISCVNNANIQNINIPPNADYVRFSISTEYNKPQFRICTNGNQALNDSVNNLNDNLNDDDSSGATSEASDFFSDFSTNTFGLTSIITAPLNLIQSLTSSTCTQLHLPLPYLDNKYLDLPCMTSIYQQYFGSFFTMYQTITYGIIAYWVIVRIFNQVKDFKNPEHDEIEVVDL